LNDPQRLPLTDNPTRPLPDLVEDHMPYSIEDLHAKLNQQVSRLERLEREARWVETQVAIQRRTRPSQEQL
jgi:hypothetical protein